MICFDIYKIKFMLEFIVIIIVIEGLIFLIFFSIEVLVLDLSFYVKVRLGIIWGEFCFKLEYSLK